MGRPAKNVDSNSTLKRFCPCCGKETKLGDLWKSHSKIHEGYGFYIPICKSCLEQLYDEYADKYIKEAEEAGIDIEEREYENYIEKKTIKRLCMMNDIYYSDKLFDSALKNSNKNTMFSSYMKIVNLIQYKRRIYDDTIYEEEHPEVDEEEQEEIIENFSEAKKLKRVNQKTVKFFGAGFSEDDYEYLQEQYSDWTTRHECKTKAQEEVFKQICFTQLELLKATRAKQDTKDLTATFQKLLDTAKLQPKQNHSDTLSETQTFGTLIDKWENTRPLPEIDEELKDVDKIGLYVDVFFKGHLSKMMGLKNAFSNLYTKFMKKYTVNKPEYNSDDNSEVIFDAVFGNQNTSKD